MKGTIAGLIVAAGYSSRMKAFKPLLEFGHMTAIERLVNTYKQAGIERIYIVVGHNKELVIEHMKEKNVQIVVNKNYDRGMFSSVQKGVETMDGSIAGFFMHPVDIPLVKVQTLKLVMQSFESGGGGIHYPAFRDKKGHPPLVDMKYKKAILESSGEGGLKRVLENYPEDSKVVETFDQSILMDMDRPVDYERLLKYDNGVPTEEECIEILRLSHVNAHIIGHSLAVKRAVKALLQVVKTHGFKEKIEPDLLVASALLHDISREEKHHAKRGAEKVERLGYPRVACVIARHMELEGRTAPDISASEILFLADKMVQESSPCTIDQRFGCSIEKYKSDPVILQKILRRKETAYGILKKIEQIADIEIDELNWKSLWEKSI